MCNICTLQQVEKKYNYAIIHFLHLDPTGKKKKKKPLKMPSLGIRYDIYKMNLLAASCRAETPT